MEEEALQSSNGGQQPYAEPQTAVSTVNS
jgi:hypothetical protein